MKQQINSIWDLVDSRKDAPETTKSPCFPVPYDIIAVVKPAVGGKRGIIPCVRLQKVSGNGHELRRCDNILKPCAGESIDIYLKRLEDELCRRDILGETV